MTIVLKFFYYNLIEHFYPAFTVPRDPGVQDHTCIASERNNQPRLGEPFRNLDADDILCRNDPFCAALPGCQIKDLWGLLFLVGTSRS